MDPLPLVTANFTNADVTYSLRRAFQDTLDGHTYDIEVAKIITDNDVDQDLAIKKTAEVVLDRNLESEDTIERIDNAGRNIIEQQVQYLVAKERIESCFELKEHLRLKNCNLLEILQKEFVEEFCLIEASDLLPDIIKQYLDFRYYSIPHVCELCSKKRKLEIRKQKKPKYSCTPSKLARTEVIKSVEAFRVRPGYVTFHNYTPGQLYKKIIRIVNTSCITQSISIRRLPKNSIFFVHLDANSRLAPGMSVTATVIFQPKIFRNLEDDIVFKNTNGFTVELPLRASRDSPELISCLFKSTCNLLNVAIPGTKKFSDTRREALNSSIDCGSCLVGQYVLISVLFENKGMPAKFFVITEDDWFSQDVASVSTCMEMFKNGFWIYPTFFEIATDEIVELSVIFEPTRPGLHLETLYMICDNNSFEELEVMGDAFEFSKNMIDICTDRKDISKKPDYCIYLGTVENSTTQELNITVENKSSICFKCIWKFVYESQTSTVRELKEEWIKTESPYQKYLVPYSKCSFRFKITFDSQESGYHGTNFRFFVLNIPLVCLDEKQKFSFIKRNNIEGKIITEAADIQITNFEVVCQIDFPSETNPSLEQCDCETCEVPKQAIPKVNFSEPLMNIGILPVGLNISKNLYVQCLVDQKINWRIAEIRYNIDKIPHIEVLKEDNLSCNSGKFNWRGQMKEISYNIIDRKPMRGVTVLALLTMDDEIDAGIESICVVTYEIIDLDIVINTGHSIAPILCPLELLYVDVPTQWEFKIENRSPIAGGFYFLKPYGKDSVKINVEFDPQSSILKPFESRTVVAKITCSDVGLYDNMIVPCFVGIGREPIEIRVMCGVDSLHVCFQLQGDAKNNNKQIVWPPRVVYEFDKDWSFCQCTEEQCLDYEESIFHENFEPVTSSQTQNSKSEISQNNPHDSIDNENITPADGMRSLEEILRDEFEEEPFMLEEIVEIRNIPINTPTKTTVCIKNITPMTATFTTDVQNFYANKNLDPWIGKNITKNAVSIWNDLIGTEYGILVQPEIEKGNLAPYGSTEVRIWIFANTYGIYSEEITFDIPDIPPFSFTLLMEVIGNPVVFPMILNSTLNHPIIRIGCIPYNDPRTNRQIAIRNSSCIPLHIVWQTFVKTYKGEENAEPDFSVAFDIVDDNYNSDRGRIVMFDEYLGKNTNLLCGTEPRYLNMEAKTDGIVNIFLDPKCFSLKLQQTHVKCHVMGHIYLQEIHRSKLNYFYRRTDQNTNNVVIELSATLELPILTLDSICGETKLIVYANDVIFKKIFHHYARLVLRNRSMSTCEALMKIEEPFLLRTSKLRTSQEGRISVKGLDCQEVTITCYIDYQEILDLSKLVYEDDPDGDSYMSQKTSRYSRNLREASIAARASHISQGKAIYCTDKENKVLHIKKRLHILQFGKVDEIIPIEMFIYFPNIKVKPANVKFGSVLLNTTRKTMISVYNLTGCAVKFEIYKSANSSAFYVTPHFAEIPRSTGSNKEFVDIFIYFTPTDCKAYQESIRIVTNIPNYFIEVPIKATGTVNEKFYVNYKI